MDMTNLLTHQDELITYMKEHGYKENYIHSVQCDINWIDRHKDGNTWESYKDIYNERIQTVKDTRLKRTTLGLLKTFDEDHQFPDGRHLHKLIPRDAYSKLCSEFTELIDFAAEHDLERGLKESNVRQMMRNTSCFLLGMQELGRDTIMSIQEEDVLSFFVGETEEGESYPLRSQSYVKCVRLFLKSGLGWRDGACSHIIRFLPESRVGSKNIRYLSIEEARLIDEALDAGVLNRRDTAMVRLLLGTGLRACDVIGLELEEIDWENNVLRIDQQKTAEPNDLPLSAVVGNAIYDYLKEERPRSDSRLVFLTQKAPYKGLASGTLQNVVSKLFDHLGIRQGERRGCHIFRYRIGTGMLENSVPAPVISATLGHTSPESLNPYVQADMVHLRECALSVEPFPVNEEVFRVS